MKNLENQQINLSLVIPCYNEQESIPVFYEEASKIEVINNGQCELLFIDDGSNDDTLEILKKIAYQDTRVHFISFSRNFGKEAAMLAGLQAAKGKYVVIIDADGQDPLSLIPQMLEAVSSGEYDCVCSRRVNRKGEPPVRSFFARCFYSLIKKLSDIDVVDSTRDFRLMNSKYLNAFLELTERNRFSKAIFPWIGFKVKWLEYENIKRNAGKTKWSFWKLFRYSMDGIIAFSAKPLAVASMLGVLLFIISLAFIIFIIIRKLIWGDPVDGWASTVCVVLFCSGLQLFTIGILGQYMAKTYQEVKLRPHFIVKEAQ